MTIVNIYGKPTSCRHGSKCWVYINLYLVLTQPQVVGCSKYLHFTDKETETQRMTLG